MRNTIHFCIHMLRTLATPYQKINFALYLDPHWQTVQKRDNVLIKKGEPRFPTVVRYTPENHFQTILLTQSWLMKDTSEKLSRSKQLSSGVKKI